nr:uncharacterized protein LOC112284596 [Physcomitrium patens]|eukprot:XP_024380284.1 uncharacterized protein LOC112284596 [Physcomitrella patens]
MERMRTEPNFVSSASGSQGPQYLDTLFSPPTGQHPEPGLHLQRWRRQKLQKNGGRKGSAAGRSQGGQTDGTSGAVRACRGGQSRRHGVVHQLRIQSPGRRSRTAGASITKASQNIVELLDLISHREPDVRL